MSRATVRCTVLETYRLSDSPRVVVETTVTRVTSSGIAIVQVVEPSDDVMLAKRSRGGWTWNLHALLIRVKRLSFIGKALLHTVRMTTVEPIAKSLSETRLLLHCSNPVSFMYVRL